MRLKVGKIVNTHSLKGEVKVISSTDFEEQRFKKGSELLITRGNQVVKEVVVESYRTHKNNLLVKFVGIDTIEEAEKLKNLQIKIDSDNIGELEENEFYFHEIIGCEVFDENNKILGEIVEILTPGANDVWVIKAENGKEILIPYIEDVVKKIKTIDKIKNITLTTNGTRLEKYIDFLYDVGIQNINISLDSLSPQKYREITNFRLDKIVEVIKKIKKYDFFRIKINVVPIDISEEEYQTW